MKSVALWLRELTIPAHRRQMLPASCYDTCNNAVVEAQAIGKSPDICEPNSLFVQYYTDCLVCSESSGIGVPTDLSSSIDQYTKYGESIGIDPPVAIATTVTITISGRPLGVPITTVLGASNNTASSSLNTTSNSMTSFSNTGTKNPSMRIRQQISKSLHNYEKPQLHSDCVPRPNPHELGNTEVAELPAPVPELRGTEVFPELSDTSRENNGVRDQLHVVDGHKDESIPRDESTPRDDRT